jgi:hypothetical protein
MYILIQGKTSYRLCIVHQMLPSYPRIIALTFRCSAVVSISSWQLGSRRSKTTVSLKKTITQLQFNTSTRRLCFDPRLLIYVCVCLSARLLKNYNVSNVAMRNVCGTNDVDYN